MKGMSLSLYEWGRILESSLKFFILLPLVSRSKAVVDNVSIGVVVVVMISSEVTVSGKIELLQDKGMDTRESFGEYVEDEQEERW